MSGNAVLLAICGLLVMLTSMVVWTHEILLSPDRPNYPTGKKWTRHLMFVWAVVLLYRAMEFYGAAWHDERTPVTPGQFLGCVMVFLVHASFLESHMRQWLPARTHKLIRRLLSIASCGHSEQLRKERRRNNGPLHPGVPRGSESPGVTGPALAELTMGGATVIPPNAGPEDLIQAGR